MKKRFSKQEMLIWLHSRIERLEKNYGFSRDNGWAQIDGKPQNVVNAYGQYVAFRAASDAIEYGEVAQ